MSSTAQAVAPSAEASSAPATPLRVVMQQPALPRYRVPVFRELANRPGIDFRLWYAAYPGLPNASPEGFLAEARSTRTIRLLGQELWWSSAQWQACARDHADVAILSWSTRYASLIPALLRARLGGVRAILWGHGHTKRPSRLRRWFLGAVTRLAHAVVFYNHTHAEHFIAHGGDRRRVFVALNALDQTPIQRARRAWLESPGRLDAWRREHDLADRPVVLFVSRLEPDNRVDLLIDAAKALVARRDDLRVIIVGKGPDEGRLRAHAEHAGLAKHVLLPGAIYDEEQLAAYFLSATCFCYPRNIGLSILHAFGYGVPVVTGDDLDSHNPEIEALRPGENGLLYKDGDADDLARALGALIDDPALARRLGEEALRTATHTFTLSNMVDGFEAAIRSCPARQATAG